MMISSSSFLQLGYLHFYSLFSLTAIYVLLVYTTSNVFIAMVGAATIIPSSLDVSKQLCQAHI